MKLQYSYQLEKYSQPKIWELCFTRWEFLELQAREAASQINPERTTLRRGREEPAYTEVLQQRTRSRNIKRLFLIKGNQISQVKEFSTCLYGKLQESGPIEIIPFICISAILCFFPSWAPLGSLQGVATIWWLLDHRYSSPSCGILDYWYFYFSERIENPTYMTLFSRFNNDQDCHAE